MSWIRRAKRAWVLVLVVPAAWWAAGLWKSSSEPQPTPLPVILERVQSLGELHTTRYAYNNVFEYETSRQPADWANRIGMGGLVRSATKNSALVSAHGTVEAGVDLSRASVRYETSATGRTLVVILPEPTVYRPHVDAKLHSNRSGLFWRDTNLPLKAQADAGQRFVTASYGQGIVEAAKASATTRLQAFLKSVTEVPVRVEFATGL